MSFRNTGAVELRSEFPASTRSQRVKIDLALGGELVQSRLLKPRVNRVVSEQCVERTGIATLCASEGRGEFGRVSDTKRTTLKDQQSRDQARSDAPHRIPKSRYSPVQQYPAGRKNRHQELPDRRAEPIANINAAFRPRWIVRKRRQTPIMTLR